MAYYLDIFSPETYESFSNSPRDISGFRLRQTNAAKRVVPGDRLVCYLTKLSRWAGLLEVLSESFIDDAARFLAKNDPYVVRFRVRPLVWLPLEQSLPIREDFIWNQLSITKGHEKHSSSWTGLFRSSLNRLDDADGEFLEQILIAQAQEGRFYPIDEAEYRKLLTQRVKSPEGEVSVSVPVGNGLEKSDVKDETVIRESLKVQAIVAQIGEKMGFTVWIPRNDRSRVLQEWRPEPGVLIDELPLSYDQTTLKTIEQIDVIWLKRRSIVRAFEVEHTTSIYSGILRMADLLALQPNMDIKLHLVAPANRREKVFEEIQRPVFSLLERRPLAAACTFISYDSLYELARQKHLGRMSDAVLEDYEESVE